MNTDTVLKTGTAEHQAGNELAGGGSIKRNIPAGDVPGAYHSER